MIIVYISIILVAASLIYLGWFAFKTLKAAKPTINELNHTVARVQQRADTIKVETTKLTQNQQELMADINQKKQAFTSTVLAAKQTTTSVKQLWKIQPFSKTARKKRKMKTRITMNPVQS